MSEAKFRNLVSVMEVFNGERFYAGKTVGIGVPEFYFAGGNLAPKYDYSVNPPGGQLSFLLQGYDALRESVYGALALQTRNEMHSHEARRASHEGRRHRLHGEGKHGDVDATLHRTGLAAVRLALIGPACDERGAGLHLATDHRERDGAEPR